MAQRKWNRRVPRGCRARFGSKRFHYRGEKSSARSWELVRPKSGNLEMAEKSKKIKAKNNKALKNSGHPYFWSPFLWARSDLWAGASQGLLFVLSRANKAGPKLRKEMEYHTIPKRIRGGPTKMEQKVPRGCRARFGSKGFHHRREKSVAGPLEPVRPNLEIWKWLKNIIKKNKRK